LQKFIVKKHFISGGAEPFEYVPQAGPAELIRVYYLKYVITFSDSYIAVVVLVDTSYQLHQLVQLVLIFECLDELRGSGSLPVLRLLSPEVTSVASCINGVVLVVLLYF